VVARGRGLGASAVATDGDRALLTVAEMQAQLTMAMGGVAAEDTRLGSTSTTAEDDIERATNLARQMVGLYGMSETVGRVRVLSRAATYLGDDGTSLDTVSARTVEAFDAEVRRLLAAAEARARAIVADNSAHLDALVERLQAEETLEGDALASLLARVVPVPLAGANGSAGTDTRATTAPPASGEAGRQGGR
jgi:cell division protease FtsH